MLFFTRASDYSPTPQTSPQFLIDGKYWFGGLGLNLAGAFIRCGSNGVEASADYIANGADYFSGLNLRNAVLASNYGWGIYAPNAYLDLSTLHGALITQNGVGAINAGVRGAALSLNNIEGQQKGHELRLSNAQIHSTYAESIGTCPVIQINDSSAVEAGPQPLVSNAVPMPYYYGCDNSSLIRVYDGRPVFAKESYFIDSVAGWALPRLADGMFSVCDPVGCTRYLWREPRSTLALTESMYWTTAFDLLVRFGETWCRALPIGTSSSTAASVTLDIPRQVTAGDTALISFAAHASNSVSYLLVLTVEVKVNGSWTTGFASAVVPHGAQNDTATQATIAFKHSADFTDVRVTVAPYGGSAGHGVSISPVYSATIPAAKTSVQQFAIESLLANYGDNVTGLVYAEDSSPAVLDILPNVASDSAIVTATVDVYSASSAGRALQRVQVTYLGGNTATIVGTPSITGFTVATSGRGVALAPNDVAQDTSLSVRSSYSVQLGASDSWDWYLDEIAKIIQAPIVAAYLATDATYSSALTGWPARIGNTATVLGSPAPTWEKTTVSGRVVLQNASNFWVTDNHLDTTLPSNAGTVLLVGAINALPFGPGANTVVGSSLTAWGGATSSSNWYNGSGPIYRNGSATFAASLSRSLYEVESAVNYSGAITIGGISAGNGYRNFLGDLEALLFLPNHLTAYQRAALVSLTNSFARLGL